MNIGIYHVFIANRKAIIKELSDLVGCSFVEIDHWKKMETVLADLIVICSPEFLPSCVSVQQFKDFIKKLNKTLIIVAYDIQIWRMDRSHTFYLENPDLSKTMNDLKTILVLEKLQRSNHSKALVNSG